MKIFFEVPIDNFRESMIEYIPDTIDDKIIHMFEKEKDVIAIELTNEGEKILNEKKMKKEDILYEDFKNLGEKELIYSYEVHNVKEFSEIMDKISVLGIHDDGKYEHATKITLNAKSFHKNETVDINTTLIDFSLNESQDEIERNEIPLWFKLNLEKRELDLSTCMTLADDENFKSFKKLEMLLKETGVLSGKYDNIGVAKTGTSYANINGMGIVSNIIKNNFIIENRGKYLRNVVAIINDESNAKAVETLVEKRKADIENAISYSVLITDGDNGIIAEKKEKAQKFSLTTDFEKLYSEIFSKDPSKRSDENIKKLYDMANENRNNLLEKYKEFPKIVSFINAVTDKKIKQVEMLKDSVDKFEKEDKKEEVESKDKTEAKTRVNPFAKKTPSNTQEKTSDVQANSNEDIMPEFPPYKPTDEEMFEAGNSYENEKFEEDKTLDPVNDREAKEMKMLQYAIKNETYSEKLSKHLTKPEYKRLHDTLQKAWSNGKKASTTEIENIFIESATKTSYTKDEIKQIFMSLTQKNNMSR